MPHTTTRLQNSPREVVPDTAGEPQQRLCPLSGGRLVDPVRAADGVAYSQTALADWMAAHATLPSGVAIGATDSARPDYHLRDQLDADADDAADLLLDPITQDRFTDPVVASDGRTYDLSTIREIYRRQGRSPFTREPLDRTVYRSRSLRAELGLTAPVESTADLATAARAGAAAVELPEGWTPEPMPEGFAPPHELLLGTREAPAHVDYRGPAHRGAATAAGIAAWPGAAAGAAVMGVVGLPAMAVATLFGGPEAGARSYRDDVLAGYRVGAFAGGFVGWIPGAFAGALFGRSGSRAEWARNGDA